uniref:Uncharacterized protein n=1 Tax=Solanum tuberosum TaxID=4113 RepID=M1DSP1_SOLTU
MDHATSWSTFLLSKLAATDHPQAQKCYPNGPGAQPHSQKCPFLLPFPPVLGSFLAFALDASILIDCDSIFPLAGWHVSSCYFWSSHICKTHQKKLETIQENCRIKVAERIDEPIDESPSHFGEPDQAHRND